MSLWQPWSPLLPRAVACLRFSHCSLSSWTLPCTLLFKNFFPPVVTGCVITIIGLSLLRFAGWWVATIKHPTGEEYFFGFTHLRHCDYFKHAASIRRLSILLAIVAGTILSWASAILVRSAQVHGCNFLCIWFAYLWTECHFINATLVIMTETTADIIAVGDIPMSILNVSPMVFVQICSRCTYLWFVHAKCFCPKCWAITGIKSRFVVAAGGVILWGYCLLWGV